jgi:phage-related protein
MNVNKIVYIDERAKRFLHSLDRRVIVQFHTLFDLLKVRGKLQHPDSKKVTKNLFEIRIRMDNQYRGFYAYIKRKQIIILHIFIKKTQKTPRKEILTAIKRLKQNEKNKL